jgi:histidinol-phosphate aminotransferase
MNAPLPPMTDADPARVTARVQEVIRADIRALSAYHVQKPGDMIKLDANESPYGLSDAARAQVAAAVAGVSVNRYPDGGGDAVKAALRRALDLGDDSGIVLGNGADELLQMLTTVVAQPGAVIMAPEPSFVMYRLDAVYAGVRYVGVPLAADFSLDVDAMLAAIERERPALVWLATPNNPTGNRFPTAHVERILAAAPGLVAVDEAYGAFADASASFVHRTLEFANLVVVRTVSKIGMAGLRLGYAVAHAAWAAELEKVRPPYNINALTQAVVPVVLLHRAELAQHVAAICAERARLCTAIAALPRVTVFPTEANFVLVRVPDAQQWTATLREAGILVKNLHGGHPLLVHCLRITVGTPAENDALIKALSRCQ